MSQLFDILLRAEKASQVALDQIGRTPYPTLGVVVAQDDPEGKRRVKVVLASNPQVQSDWLRRLTPFPAFDPPMPEIGQTVLIFYADGLETNGYYLQLVNDTNPALEKGDVLKDYASNIPGDRTVEVSGKDTLSADDIETNSEKDMTAEVKGNIFMNALQAITLQAAQYVMLKAGNWFIRIFSNGTTQMGGGVLTVDCGGFGISFVNVGTMSINGKSIATLTAVDSRGDSLVTRGW